MELTKQFYNIFFQEGYAREKIKLIETILNTPFQKANIFRIRLKRGILDIELDNNGEIKFCIMKRDKIAKSRLYPEKTILFGKNVTLDEFIKFTDEIVTHYEHIKYDDSYIKNAYLKEAEKNSCVTYILK